MRILVFSDSHFGFGLGTEREDDSFLCMKEGIEENLDSDLIIICGDVFDTRIPTTETFTKAMEIFLKPKLKKTTLKPVEGIGKDIESLPKPCFFGVPIIALHGNHERRVRGFLNPVEALERAGFLIHLHCNGIVFKKGDEKICIQGMSAVPDQYVPSVLDEWNPKPVKDALNIFLFHQIISAVLNLPNTLNINILPKGFDLYLCGDFHETKKLDYNGSPLLIPGSVISTQLGEESVNSRGYWVIEIEGKKPKIEFKTFKNQRKVYYKEFEKDEKNESGQVEEYLNDILKNPHNMKPVVRIKIRGKLESENHLKEKFQDRAIISFRKEAEEEAIAIKTIEEQKLSVQELGRELLRNNLAAQKLDAKTWEDVFELLLNNKPEDAANIVRKSVQKE